MSGTGISTMADGGSGTKLTTITIILAGVASLIATIISVVSIFMQLKNYRKPLLQRHVVRILVMVPIYSAASFTSLLSLKGAFYVDAVRDVYEAFTIYTFLQLLVNFLGGERSLIIMMHGRAPVSHTWPMNLWLNKIDISDPHTFLGIKRGILQYAWLKPVLALASIIMKLTNTYKEGYIGVSSGYFWSGLVYNISIFLSLYCLAMFWVCMSEDLEPFRPMPKFLCIKLIIFASWWQGFFLSILQFLGALPSDVEGYSEDNLATAIQDALICFEMIGFALAHWYAFSWHDYADETISAARMPVKFAFRDAFGIRDLIEDSRETFRGTRYDYRTFDSGDNVIAHEESQSRWARMADGMRYSRNGGGKYWIPKPHNPNSRTPLLAGSATFGAAPEARGKAHEYRSADPNWEIAIDPEDERLYDSARELEFGDWNYPVITAHHARREDWINREPDLLTTSTNRNLFQPTKDYRTRRKTEIRKSIHKGKARSSSSSHKDDGTVESKLRNDLHPHQENAKEDQDQLVDLVVEDHVAEERERVRARKEGGDAWNSTEQKHFIRTYGDNEEEEIREGYEPSEIPAAHPVSEYAVAEDEEDGDDARNSNGGLGKYGNLAEERNVWDSPKAR